VNCPVCSEIIDSEMTFCPKCGGNLDGAVAHTSGSDPSADSTAPEPSPPAQTNFVRNCWIVFASMFLAQFAELFGEPGALLAGIYPVLAAIYLAVVIYKDADNHGLQKLKLSSIKLSSFDRMSPGAWAVGSFLLALIFVPVYLVKRNRLVATAHQTITSNLFMNEQETKAGKKKEIWSTVLGSLFLLSLVAALYIWAYGCN
jgi:hypothetical protein